jgi:hypothetical protein
VKPSIRYAVVRAAIAEDSFMHDPSINSIIESAQKAGT